MPEQFARSKDSLKWRPLFILMKKVQKNRQMLCYVTPTWQVMTTRKIKADFVPLFFLPVISFEVCRKNEVGRYDVMLFGFRAQHILHSKIQELRIHIWKRTWTTAKTAKSLAKSARWGVTWEEEKSQDWNAFLLWDAGGPTTKTDDDEMSEWGCCLRSKNFQRVVKDFLLLPCPIDKGWNKRDALRVLDPPSIE